MLSAGAGAALAEPRPAALGWTRLPGAEDCIGSVELAASVEARLHRALLVPPARAAHALEGRVEPREGGAGFRAVIALSDREGVVLGERTIESDGASCRDLDPTLVLAVSLLLDPDAAPAPPDAERAPVSPAAPEPARGARRGPETPAPPPPAPGRLARVYTELGAIFGVGMLPGIFAEALAVGGLARVTVPFRWVGFEVAVAWWPSHVTDATSPRFARLQVDGGICGAFALHPRAALFPCSGVSVGGMKTRARPAPFDQALVDLFSEVRLHVQVAGPVRLAIEVGAHVPLVRWRADTSTRTYVAPPVAGTGVVSFGWAFE